MSCGKAAIYVANTNAQTVAAGGNISFGSIVRRFGNDSCCNPIINSVNGAVVLNECGYYAVTVRVTDAPTDAGAVTVTLNQDGNPVQGAVATNTAAAASAATSVTISAIVRVIGCASSTLTAVLTAGAGSVTNATIDVVKIK